MANVPRLLSVTIGVFVAVLGGTLLPGAAVGSQPNIPNPGPPASHIAENVIPLINAGGSFISTTFDCPGTCSVAGGWGDDVWKLTLTQPSDVTIQVQDCCAFGDAYEILLDCDHSPGAAVDTNHDNDCSIFHSSPGFTLQGTTVGLPAGTYTIRIHDDGGQCTAGCPAGYTVDIGVTTPLTAAAPTCIARVDGLGPSFGQLPCLPIGTAAPTMSHRMVVITIAMLSLIGFVRLRKRWSGSRV